jgi:sporulation protein YqfD
MLGVMLPGRILFISVEGNERIPDQLILESAERCGIRFGADRRKVKSEKVKNMLLGELQDLKWAGVNTYGCRAVVTVREKERVVSEKPMPPVSHIVAARDGIITSRTAIRGTNMCQPGQAVKSGDILISGYTDCGITIISGRAEGEIMAQTKRDLTAVTPSVSRFREQHFKNEVRYSVLIGKNRINFFKGSGISGGSCVKMSMKYVLTLPGGFTLPISVIKETVTECALSGQPSSDLSQLLRVFTEDYLKKQMVAGSIIHKAEQIHESDGLVMLTGSYTCSEDIGIVQEEKIGEHNGKADGTDRERGSGG